MTTATLHFGSIADAYLEWAYLTGFQNFYNTQSASAPTPTDALTLLVQWKNGATPARNAALATALDNAARPASVYDKTPICILNVPLNKMDAWLLPGSGTLYPFVQRIELASPLAPDSYSTHHHHHEFYIIGKRKKYLPPSGAVLLGVIDFGCPFASSRFMNAGTTRLWQLWDQNANDSVDGQALNGNESFPPRTNFGYGKQWARGDVAQLIAGTQGQDETQAYETLGWPHMRQRATHGAHVMDVLAGPIAVANRVSPSRNVLQGQDSSATEPPDWAPTTDLASQADMVFVQLPKSAVNDPTGRWLGHAVLDGLHYIVQCAKKWNDARDNVLAIQQRIVCNISWGSQTGAHNGASLLELAVDQLCQANPLLSVVFAAGNAYQDRGHAQVDLGASPQTLNWQVPPGNEFPSFLECWWPQGMNANDVAAAFTVISPNGETLTVCATGAAYSGNDAQASSYGLTLVGDGQGRVMTLLALAPTTSHSNDRPVAPHGTWTLNFVGIATQPGTVQVYVARTAVNVGGVKLSTPSYLSDPQYDPQCWLRPVQSDAGSPASLVKRQGTLNGIATGGMVVVAAGYQRSTGGRAPYSSVGPSNGLRGGPDWALPSDESPVARGVLAGGNRSGSVVRLVGTSAAAPQLARTIANNMLTVPPAPVPPPDSAFGQGRLP